ncbi:MAG: cation:proton antiporter [Rhodobacteraceae bacterium]|nr:cation:proton antiporter [Paracoccaceae bacterium]
MSDNMVTMAVDVSFALIILSILLSFVRLIRGPSLADRVVALDMMTVSIVAFAALFAIRTDDPVFLDIALVLALIGFLTTVALARYAERRLESLIRNEETSSGPTEPAETEK